MLSVVKAMKSRVGQQRLKGYANGYGFIDRTYYRRNERDWSGDSQ